MKVCVKCGIEKDLEEFRKHKRTKDGRDSWCKDCYRIYMQRWGADPVNRKQKNEASRQWIANPANRKRNSEMKRQWKKNNPERQREANRRRHAIKQSVDAEKIDLLVLYERDNWTCYLCGLSVDPKLKWPDPGSASQEHVIPLAKNGTHTWDNVRLAHWGCNLSKGAKLLEDLK